MKVNMEAIGQPSWVDWRDGARFLLSPAPITKMNDIRKKSFKRNPIFENREKFMDTEFDAKTYIVEIATLILDWENLVDQHDKPIPCSAQMKFTLLNYGVSFDEDGQPDKNSMAGFVVDEAQKLATFYGERLKEEKENFLSSGGG